jgi:hypothetical protein
MPGAAEGVPHHVEPLGYRRSPGTAPWAPNAPRRRCTSSRASRGPRFTGSAEHVTSRTGDAWRRGHGGRVPGIRRPRSGQRPVDSLSAMPGSRTRVSENEEGATAGVAATPDARRTGDGCRASAGRHPGEGRPKLFQRCPAPARATRRTMRGVTAGVRSLRMCRRRFEHVWAHSQGGHPREGRNEEACIGGEEGRRDARRWPTPLEDNERLTPPQGGEPERRRDERRMRRQAGIPEKRPQGRCASRRKGTPMVPVVATTTELRTWHPCE